MDDKERTDTCDMQEITWDNMAYHRTRHKACTKVALGVTTHDERSQILLDKDIQRTPWTRRAVKAEEMKEQIRMEAIDRDRAMQINANDMWEIPGRTYNAFKTKKAIKKP